MPYVHHKDRKSEKVHGIDGAALFFNSNGYAETDDAELAEHFSNIPGYKVLDELPEVAGKVHKSEFPRVPAPGASAPNTGSDNADGAVDPNSESGVESIAGYTREDLEAMTNPALFELANDLGVVIENPRATKAQLVEAILTSGQ